MMPTIAAVITVRAAPVHNAGQHERNLLADRSTCHNRDAATLAPRPVSAANAGSATVITAKSGPSCAQAEGINPTTSANNTKAIFGARQRCAAVTTPNMAFVLLALVVGLMPSAWAH